MIYKAVRTCDQMLDEHGDDGVKANRNEPLCHLVDCEVFRCSWMCMDAVIKTSINMANRAKQSTHPASGTAQLLRRRSILEVHPS